VLVKVRGDGLTGWGESASPSDPYYCEETTETCWHLLKDFLAPAVLGHSWDDVETLVGFYAEVKRNHFAKAGLEMACWDLASWATSPTETEARKQAMAEARSAAGKAMELDPNFSESHLVKGTLLLYSDWVWEAAGKAIKRALELDPNNAFALGIYSEFLQPRLSLFYKSFVQLLYLMHHSCSCKILIVYLFCLLGHFVSLIFIHNQSFNSNGQFI